MGHVAVTQRLLPVSYDGSGKVFGAGTSDQCLLEIQHCLGNQSASVQAEKLDRIGTQKKPGNHSIPGLFCKNLRVPAYGLFSLASMTALIS